MQPAKNRTRSREHSPEDHPHDEERVEEEHSSCKSRIEVRGHMHNLNLLQPGRRAEEQQVTIDRAKVHAEHREPCTENHFVFAGNTEVIRLASGEPCMTRSAFLEFFGEALPLPF